MQADPHDAIRQECQQVLIGSYGYRQAEIDTLVALPSGSRKADIVVYAPRSRHDPATDIIGIIETGKRGATEGLAQLKAHMTATSAAWGVWTDGDDIRYLCKPPGSDDVYDDLLHNIPARGQSLSDVGKLTKDDLRPYGRHELKAAFRRILHTLYANSNISRRDRLGNEMVKLIFAKLHDEVTCPDQPPMFRVGFGESTHTVRERVGGLFAQAVSGLDLFESNNSITLDAHSVAWVVGQLERGSLTGTDADVIGDAFEVFAESKIVRDQGEFFTPRGVTDVAMKLADPKPGESVCDPACGSGGFMIAAMRHIGKQMDDGNPGENVYGIDKEADLVRLAKAHMMMIGGRPCNVAHGNSLRALSDFSDEAQSVFGDDESQFRTFDYVFTNPPYGSKTRVMKQDARLFELGRRWMWVVSDEFWISGEEQDTDPYLLFVERSVDLLRDGGVLAIVLPEAAFHAPSKRRLRDWITDRCAVRAVVSLPHNTFRPHCNAKTCLLVVQKGGEQGDVIMAHPEEMGHDHKGRPLLRPGTGEIWDDLSEVVKDLDGARPARFVFPVPWDEIAGATHWIPKFYRQRRSLPALPEGRQWHRLGDLHITAAISAWDGHGSPASNEKGRGDIPYIRVNDIMNWEMYRNPTSGVDATTYNRLADGKPKPQSGDIIFVRRGSYRIGTVAMASPLDADVLLTRELLTIRVHSWNIDRLTPYYLLALLSSDTVQAQIDGLVFMDTTLPTIGDRWKDILLPLHKDIDEMQRVSARVEEAVRRKWEAQSMIHGLQDELGRVVT